MKNFIHIIITRFNVPTTNWVTTRDGQQTLTDEWLKHRFDLFLKYTLPSFKNQTNKDFYWFVFFDIKTPLKFKKVIHDIHENLPQFQAIYISHFDEMQPTLKEIIPRFYKSNTKYVISAEIDNDDILHKDYIKVSQELYTSTHNLVLDIRKGYQITFLPKNTIITNAYYATANPFVAIVESTDKFESILKENHKNYRYYKKLVVYDAKPLFIQTIHGNNISNKTFKTKCIMNPNLTEFGIKEFKINYGISLMKNIKHYVKVIFSILGKI